MASIPNVLGNEKMKEELLEELIVNKFLDDEFFTITIGWTLRDYSVNPEWV